MTRDTVIGVVLLFTPIAILAAGAVLGSDVLVLFGVGGLGLAAPAGYKLLRYPPTRIVSFGSVVTKARSRKRGWSRKGMLVSFSGIDGSGKTTLATRLVERLDDRGVTAVHRWARWRPLLSYPLMGVLYLGRGWRRKDYHRSGLLRRVWGYVLLADMMAYTLLYVRPRLARGEVVCVDRYVLDTVVEMDYDGLYNERVVGLMQGVLPTPDCHFYLEVPPNVALERKGDTAEMLDRLGIDASPDTYLEDRRELYRKHFHRFDPTEVDTTRPLDESTAIIETTTLEALVRF